MTGLFLNFYQVQLSANNIKLRYLGYEDYETKEDFLRLRKEYPDCFFYREGDKIIFWSCSNSLNIPNNWKPIEISEATSPKVFSKIVEDGVVNFISNLNTYRLFKNKYSNTWDIVSGKDILNGGIAGLELNRVVHFTPYFFFKDDVLIFGLTLSTSVKNRFTWSKQEFEANGVDTKGLKGDDENIYPNKQSLKRFLETKGVGTTYENVIRIENDRSKSVTTINAFYEWLNKKKSDIILPGKISISTIVKRYIPFENNLIKSEVLYKPQRYFYSNSKNTQKLQYYDQMVKAYKPYSLELYQNKKIKLGVICPKEFQGETEAFLKQIEFKLKDTFHFTDVVFNVVSAKGKALENYKDVLYDSNLLESNLVYVIVSKDHEKLAERNSPYHVCKAKLIGNGIPTQDIQIETIRKQYSAFTMTNITLNTYAKLGGTAWTIEKEDKLREELIVGVGSTIGEDGHHVLGIAQVFHNDGRYILGDCAPLSTFSDYSKNLENHFFNPELPS